MRALASRLTRELHMEGHKQLPELYRSLVAEDAAILAENEYNKGAEVVHALVPEYFPWSGDADGDDRMEAWDAYGIPVILFTSDFREDLLFDRDGLSQRVSAPPYFRDGFYFSYVWSHLWRLGDQEALDDNMKEQPTRP